MTGTDNTPMSHAELITPAFEGQQWSDLDDDHIKALFKEHGALLFRGFAGNIDQFSALTDRFCESYMINPNAGRNTVCAEKKIETVNKKFGPFELHAERHQTPPTPHICFFYCNEAPLTMGETSFCDGELLVSILRDELRDMLLGRELWYHAPVNPMTVMGLMEVDNLDDLQQALVEKKLDHIYHINGDRVSETYETPVLHKSAYSDNLAFANFLLFSRFMFKNQKTFPTFENGEIIPNEVCEEIRNTAATITVYHKWQNSDLLMLDNTRVMHGRAGIVEDGPRDIWTRFGYANF